MPAMPPIDTLTVHEPLLVNTIGHAVGAVIFAIFIYLLLADRRAGRLSLLAASLALVWNTSSLLVMALESGGVTMSLATAIGSSALSLLPAVLLHISPAGRFRWIIAPGYLLAGVAVVIHSSELLTPAPHYHRLALVLITVGFGALTVIAAVTLFSGVQAQERRRVLSSLLGTMALFLFAMSFVHFGYGEVAGAWPVELILHHAGIPLALVVLLQDYRFVLLDAFLRFLASILLAAGFTFAVERAARAIGVSIDFGGTEFRQGLLLVGGCLALIVFAMLRGRLQSALTRILFRRPELDAALERLRAAGSSAFEEGQYLSHAAQIMAQFMNAVVIDTAAAPVPGMAFPVLASDLPEITASGADVLVPLRLPHGEARLVCLGRRQGGRRYLSEDLGALARLAAEVNEQFERLHESEIKRLVSQAELRALQSQIHPHFLFNALNTLYGVIPKQAADARRLVLNLADIFRYFLQAERSFIPLEEELHIVRAYLEIESQRLGPKLRTELEIDPAVLHARIPILSVEPLVENAVKHGVAEKAEGGTVRVIAKPSAAGVLIRVEDSGKGFTAATADKSAGRGVGMQNVERRLKLCYGQESSLRITTSADGAAVEFDVPVLTEALR